MGYAGTTRFAKNVLVIGAAAFALTLVGTVDAAQFRTRPTLTSNSGLWGSPSTWEIFDGVNWVNASAANGGQIPRHKDRDVATIRSPMTVSVTADTQGASTITVNSGATLRILRRLVVTELYNNGTLATSATTPRTDAIQMAGDSTTPAIFQSSTGIVNSLRGLYVTGLAPSPNLTPVGELNGVLYLRAPVNITLAPLAATGSFLKVNGGSTLQIEQGGSITGVPTPASNPFSQFDANAGIVYNLNSPTPYTVGREWIDGASLNTLDKQPKFVTVRNGSTVDASAKTGTYNLTTGLTVELNSRFIDMTNSANKVTLTPSGVLSLSGVIEKNYTTGVANGASFTGDVSGADLTVGAANGATAIKVERIANAGATLTGEHYRITPNAGGSSFSLSTLLLPRLGATFSLYPTICRAIDGDNSFGTVNCFSPSYITAAPTTVTFNGPPNAANLTGAVDSQPTFYVNDGKRPLLVTLASFDAIATGAGNPVSLLWETESEIDNSGFHIWRARKNESGQWVRDIRLSIYIIPGEGTPGSGHAYEFVDYFPLGQNEVRGYFLEDIDLNGTSTFHGPAVTE